MTDTLEEVLLSLQLAPICGRASNCWRAIWGLRRSTPRLRQYMLVEACNTIKCTLKQLRQDKHFYRLLVLPREMIAEAELSLDIKPRSRYRHYYHSRILSVRQVRLSLQYFLESAHLL